MRVALFGGAFDPPHLGHFRITETLLQRDLADEVWYVPVKQHPFGKKVTSDAHRLAMLQLMLETRDPRVKIETYELDKEGISYTYETLEFLSQKYPEHEFSWVIGSDNLASFYKWLDIHQLLLKYPFFVYPRHGFPFEPLYPNMTPLTDVPEVTISSTQVRQAVAQGQEIASLVTPAVEKYLETQQLYAPVA